MDEFELLMVRWRKGGQSEKLMFSWSLETDVRAEG